jgi:ABC-type multidrug transport system fused ATPase/permease subunit
MGATSKEKNKSFSSTSLNITDDSRTRLMCDNSLKKTKENGFQSSSFLQMLRYATTFDYFLLIAGIIFSILDGLSAPVGCIIFKMITDALMKAQPYYMNGTLVEEYPTFNEEIIWCCSLYFFQGLNMFILTMLAMGCFYTLSERQAYKIKQHFFATVLKQDMEWFDKKEVGALTQIMTSGIDKIRNGTSDKLVLILKSTANLISGILIGFYLCWELTLVLIAMAPVLIASIYITNRMLMTQTKKEMTAYSIASSIAEEVLSSIRTVMAFNAQFFELKRYEDCLVNARKIGFRKAFIVSVCNGIYIFVEFVAIGMGFW